MTQHPHYFSRERCPMGDVHRGVMTPDVIKACILERKGKRAYDTVIDAVRKAAAVGENACNLDKFRRQIDRAGRRKLSANFRGQCRSEQLRARRHFDA